MALIDDTPPNLKVRKGKDGKWYEETIEHYKKRIADEKKKRYDGEIERIMKNGFTRKQAIYLYEQECQDRTPIYNRRY